MTKAGKTFDKVVVTIVNVESDGSLYNYGSGVKIYPFKGNFDNFENFKKFIFSYSEISNHWLKSESERNFWIGSLYDEFLKGNTASEYFRLNPNSGLSGVSMDICGISNEPIAEGSFIKVADIEL